MFENFERLVRNHFKERFGGSEIIPLHAPFLQNLDFETVTKVMKTTYVSSAGNEVEIFENQIADYLKAPHVVAVVNGTAALHLSLIASGVERLDYVITQAINFVAACNAISYIGADPIFVDIDEQNLSLCPVALENFLETRCYLDTSGNCRLKSDRRKISACIPMHTFGHSAKMMQLSALCEKYNLIVIEDAAEALGSSSEDGRFLGSLARFGVLSFNGNKIITTGGGGAVICHNEQDARLVKHLSTTAKSSIGYEFVHDRVGFNYRMPNINAALGVSQMQSLVKFLSSKRNLATKYREFFEEEGIQFFDEPNGARSNFWLNAIGFQTKQKRDEFLKISNSSGIQTRPLWHPMSKLKMFENSPTDKLKKTNSVYDKVVNLPSSAI